MRKNNHKQKRSPGAITSPGEGMESVDSYSKERIPMVGTNFSALSSLAPLTEMLTDGVSLGTAVRFSTLVHMPVDKYNSFLAKMAELYAEIRETNAGASNYTYLQLASYVLHIQNLRAWAHHIMRAQAAFRATMPNSADSPYILTAAAGAFDYSASEVALGDSFNELAVLVKDIDNLPYPPFAVFDRQETLYSKIYADSGKEKPSLVSFVPSYIMVPSIVDDDLTFTADGLYDSGGTLMLMIAALREQYMTVSTDTVFTIMRGDLRKAFGNQAYSRPLTPFLTKPLEVVYLAGELGTQLENASLVPKSVTAPNSQFTLARNTSGVFELKVERGLSGYVAQKGQYAEQVINYHGQSPSIPETLQITRFMPVYEWVDPLLDTKYLLVTADSGDTLVDAKMLTAITRTTETAKSLNTLMDEAQNSVVQSTAMGALRDLAFVTSVVRGMPMIISDPDDPRGYIWNLDNFAVVSKTELSTYHERAIRSWYASSVPRGELGRVERRP